ncbi:hypothetical protein [Enterobacter kobei]|uniref:hypothetical protein n=1 Tax=Enterobacter kobei TaxID=208224 RepID=UPI0009BC31C8|nr:hypothetical protein [Enterobacter kobei]
MITEKNNVFYCDCGFSFQRGRSGSHDCADGLRNKLAEYEARYAALAAENAGLKAAHPQPFGEDMMRALEAYEWHQDEVPETGMLDAFFILRDSIRVETPATDAFLAEVRAQGVEMFGQYHNFSKKLFIQKEAKKFAAQLRQGGAE